MIKFLYFIIQYQLYNSLFLLVPEHYILTPMLICSGVLHYQSIYQQCVTTIYAAFVSSVITTNVIVLLHSLISIVINLVITKWVTLTLNDSQYLCFHQLWNQELEISKMCWTVYIFQ